MAVHGDIIEVAYSHPTLGSGVFSPKANEGNTFDPGGFRNEDDSNMITGNGIPMMKKNRVTSFFEIVVENDMNQDNTAVKLKQLMNSTVAADWTVTVVNGSVWAGSGFPVGDIQPDVNAGTMTLKVVSGEFTKIAG
jgi:hypothetical protein